MAFVKTSTGYGFVKQPNGFYSYAGATDHALILIRAHSALLFRSKPPGVSGFWMIFCEFVGLGVTRIGATATREILEEAKNRGFS